MYKYGSRKKSKSFYIFGYLLELIIIIWRLVELFFRNLANLGHFFRGKSFLQVEIIFSRQGFGENSPGKETHPFLTHSHPKPVSFHKMCGHQWYSLYAYQIDPAIIPWCTYMEATLHVRNFLCQIYCFRVFSGRRYIPHLSSQACCFVLCMVHILMFYTEQKNYKLCNCSQH